MTTATAVTRPVPLGVIGCGHIAQVAHLPALEKSERAHLVAVCDTSDSIVSRVAQRYRVDNATTSVTELLADPRVEAVIIAAPDRFHVDLVSAALAAGKHVLVEKPLAEDSEGCQKLIKAADASGRVLQVACMKRHDPGMIDAHRHVRDVGDVLAFNVWYRVPSAKGLAVEGYLPLQFGDSVVRSIETAAKSDRERYLLATHGAHVFDTIRYLLGDVRSVFARHVVNGADHVWQGSMVLSSGGIGTFELVADVHGPWAEGLEIHSTHGTVRVDTHVPFSRRASDVRVFRDEAMAWSESAAAAADAYLKQLESFVAAIGGDGRPNPDAEEGLAAVRLIEAVATSCAIGQEVYL